MTNSLPLLPLVLWQVPEGLRRALAQTGVPCCEHSAGPTAGRFVLFDSRVAMRPCIGDGQTAIDVDALRRGHDTDPFAALEDEQSFRGQWRIGPLRVREVVARVAKRIVRRQLMRDLRTKIESAGGTWLQIGAYPHPYRSVFNFRIDHDNYVEHDFAATLDAIEGHEAAISHYVCASGFVGRRDVLSRLKGQHVGSHGFWHHTFRDAAENLRNVHRGIEALRNEGIEPVGFAAPHGRFNRGLLAALSQLGVSHGSEFGLAYDDLPFFMGNVLQIPIHPICLGICLEAAGQRSAGIEAAEPDGGTLRSLPPRAMVNPAAAAEIALAHFQRVACEAHRAGDPIFFYGHPTGRLGRFPHVLSGILDVARQLDGVWRTTLAAWEAWWRARADLNLSVVRDDARWIVRANGRPKSHTATVELWQGETVASLPLASDMTTFTPAALAFERRGAGSDLPSPQPVARNGWREGLREYLDWERVTPIDEIQVRTWRHLAKRTLRRIRA
jgi:peptidoglycan/xylan/chitin deacetylase (PgdA/CDA1 family)